MAIFPWLELREPLTAFGITIFPRAAALTAAGEGEEPLRARTNYFFDVYKRPITPSVAFFPDGPPQIARAEIERAVHALLFAASAANAPGGVAYANVTLLEFFFQRLGGPAEFVARRTRRRYGSRLDGSHTALLRAQRPDWAGSGLQPESEILAALASITDSAEHDDIFQALRWYYVGSTDADTIPPDIDRVHIRTAIERILQRPDDTQSPRTAEQLLRVGELTEQFVTWQCDIIKDAPRNHHQQALWVLIEDRNVSLHGNPSKREPYAFENMGVPLDWIFDRLFISLVIATLINRNALADNAKWRGFIEAFELWLAGASGTMSEIWSGRKITLFSNPQDRAPRPPLEPRKDFLDPAFVYVRQTQ